MKVFEILSHNEFSAGYREMPNTSKAGATMDKVDQLRAKDPTLKHLSSGNNAHVMHSEDPHNADRVWRTAKKLDGGSIWLKFVSKTPSIKGNPFVPQVIETERGDVATYQVEKLLPMFTPDIINNDELMKARAKQYLNNIDDSKTYKGNIITSINNAIDDGNYSNIKDQNLANACKAVAYLIKKFNGNMSNDLGDSNFMWRMTPTGPQLVILDPLWNKAAD